MAVAPPPPSARAPKPATAPKPPVPPMPNPFLARRLRLPPLVLLPANIFIKNGPPAAAHTTSINLTHKLLQAHVRQYNVRTGQHPRKLLNQRGASMASRRR